VTKFLVYVFEEPLEDDEMIVATNLLMFYTHNLRVARSQNVGFH